MAPVTWLFVRDRPAAGEGDVEALAMQPTDLTLGQALRTPAFWLFALASAAFGLVYSGIALFNLNSAVGNAGAARETQFHCAAQLLRASPNG